MRIMTDETPSPEYHKIDQSIALFAESINLGFAFQAEIFGNGATEVDSD